MWWNWDKKKYLYLKPEHLEYEAEVLISLSQILIIKYIQYLFTCEIFTGVVCVLEYVA